MSNSLLIVSRIVNHIKQDVVDEYNDQRWEESMKEITPKRVSINCLCNINETEELDHLKC